VMRRRRRDSRPSLDLMSVGAKPVDRLDPGARAMFDGVDAMCRDLLETST
jgi:hypothetical protein